MTSIASSADAGGERSPAAGAPRRSRLSRLLLIFAVLLPTAVAVDLSVNTTFGSDVRVNCAAVDAHREGLDPYFVKNLKGTDLSYPYLPVTLDAFRPLCAGGFLVAHYKAIYLVLGLICVLLLPGLGRTSAGLRDVVLRGVFALGGFLGFEWVLASGNFAMLSGLLTAASLALLLHPAQPEGREDASFVPQLAGAALLGLVTSFKLVFVPVLAALYLLPQPRRRRLILIAVAAAMFALPILVSVVVYPELFSSWLSAIFGQIPGQHSPGRRDESVAALPGPDTCGPPVARRQQAARGRGLWAHRGRVRAGAARHFSVAHGPGTGQGREDLADSGPRRLADGSP